MDTPGDRDELNEEELLIASQAFALEGKSFAPTAEYLPVCEDLVERGWLSKWETIIDDEPEAVEVYTTTRQARGAVEMGSLLELQPGQQN